MVVADRSRVGDPPRLRSVGGEVVTKRDLLAVGVRWPRPSLLGEPLKLRGQVAAAAQRLGLSTVGDLLEHVPAGHEFRPESSISDLRAGEEATIEGVVQSIALRPTRRRRLQIVEAKVSDSGGSVDVVWFNQGYLARRIERGMRLRIFGKLKSGSFQVREHRVLSNVASDDAQSTGLVGLYSSSEGLATRRIRELVGAARGVERNFVDPIPGRLRASERLMPRCDAIAAMHFPRSADDVNAARESLAFDELLLQQLALALRRKLRSDGRVATTLDARTGLVDRWIAGLPFELTGDQQRARETIDRDLAKPSPMQRLLMGEVGSGKTVVALAAMLRAVECGAQSALMAPTETLAKQHFATLRELLDDTPIALLTGSTTAAQRREILEALGDGTLPIVVGTHALIEPTVEFSRLGLVIVDEQHRFGVDQRAALDAKSPDSQVAHVLHMTATPIPRTLALAGYGDLDFTQIRQLPRGRQPITTRVVADGARHEAYETVREELRAGRQAYVVCPLVEQSEALEARAATAEADRLRDGEFKDFSVGLIHGQMGSDEKTRAMEAFAGGELDVLVATSVIEVGIDVPNASVIVIEDADRYGISQLHQLRGRVGRGEHPSTCMLFGPAGSSRLRALAAESDGFKLAQIDLELRGSGEELGTRQSGLPRFRVASLPTDLPLLERAKSVADRFVRGERNLDDPANVLLRAAVETRYGDELDPIPA